MFAFIRKLTAPKEKGGCCGGNAHHHHAPVKAEKAEGGCCGGQGMHSHAHHIEDDEDTTSPQGGCCRH